MQTESTTNNTALEQLAGRLEAEFPGSILQVTPGVDMPCLRVAPNAIVPVSRWLRDAVDYRFVLLADLTCVDFLDRDPRYDVVYHLYSLDSHSYLRLKVGVSAEPCECPTVTEVWEGANWLEREVYDMFGVVFTGHPDLRRILSPEGWPYFALRRDFPLQGPGVVKLYDSVTDVF
ncbi:MAG TPA: NADH-quinone oxidoreductase subunit C [Armatimonadota bacterium]|jgi:NADH-quinone oxidoreductase subunit C